MRSARPRSMRMRPASRCRRTSHAGGTVDVDDAGDTLFSMSCPLIGIGGLIPSMNGKFATHRLQVRPLLLVALAIAIALDRRLQHAPDDRSKAHTRAARAGRRRRLARRERHRARQSIGSRPATSLSSTQANVRGPTGRPGRRPRHRGGVSHHAHHRAGRSRRMRAQRSVLRIPRRTCAGALVTSRVTPPATPEAGRSITAP